MMQLWNIWRRNVFVSHSHNYNNSSITWNRTKRGNSSCNNQGVYNNIYMLIWQQYLRKEAGFFCPSPVMNIDSIRGGGRCSNADFWIWLILACSGGNNHNTRNASTYRPRTVVIKCNETVCYSMLKVLRPLKGTGLEESIQMTIQ